VHKVVLILHSQGAIEGGMVLDWLYATVSAKDIRKLEIYTFGNAANHWNAPANGGGSNSSLSTALDSSNGVLQDNQSQRLVKYIEHYANTGDYVSRFGILHFRPDHARPNSAVSGMRIFREAAICRGPQSLKWQTGTTPARRTPSANIDPRIEDKNRFIGRLFKREGSGHQLNQHYLDNIFEMKNVDTSVLKKGRVKDGNPYMDSQVDVAAIEWDTVQSIDSTIDGSGNGRAANAGTGGPTKQIKQESRLWGYRNGGDPDQDAQKAR